MGTAATVDVTVPGGSGGEAAQGHSRRNWHIRSPPSGKTKGDPGSLRGPPDLVSAVRAPNRYSANGQCSGRHRVLEESAGRRYNTLGQTYLGGTCGPRSKHGKISQCGCNRFGDGSTTDCVGSNGRRIKRRSVEGRTCSEHHVSGASDNCLTEGQSNLHFSRSTGKYSTVCSIGSNHC